jgi:hypothetical protein
LCGVGIPSRVVLVDDGVEGSRLGHVGAAGDAGATADHGAIANRSCVRATIGHRREHGMTSRAVLRRAGGNPIEGRCRSVKLAAISGWRSLWSLSPSLRLRPRTRPVAVIEVA